MLKPSVVNTPLVRAASVLGAVALVSGTTALLPGAVGAFLHVTAYAILLGTQLWNTFFVGISESLLGATVASCLAFRTISDDCTAPVPCYKWRRSRS
jgi:hypothetical protein